MTTDKKELLEQALLLAYRRMDRADDRLDAAEQEHATPEDINKLRIRQERRYAYIDGMSEVLRILGISYRIGVDETGTSNSCRIL